MYVETCMMCFGDSSSPVRLVSVSDLFLSHNRETRKAIGRRVEIVNDGT
jgi:hypothetical protein